MCRITSTLTVFVFLTILTGGVVFCEEPDISGTWVGTTEVPDLPEPDEVTLILEKEDNNYSGTISDSMGMVQGAELENIEFKDNHLTFDFLIFNGYEYTRVYMSFTVMEETMDGYWKTEDGNSSPIELKKID